MPDAIAQFAGANYLNLETFRKTGVGVRTPVWFAQDVLHIAVSRGNSRTFPLSATGLRAISQIAQRPDCMAGHVGLRNSEILA